MKVASWFPSVSIDFACRFVALDTSPPGRLPLHLGELASEARVLAIWRRQRLAIPQLQNEPLLTGHHSLSDGQTGGEQIPTFAVCTHPPQEVMYLRRLPHKQAELQHCEASFLSCVPIIFIGSSKPF